MSCSEKFQTRQLKITHFDEFYSNGFLESSLKAIAELVAERAIPIDDIKIELACELLRPDTLDELRRQGIDVSERGHSRKRTSKDLETPSIRFGNVTLFVQRGAWNGYVPERFFELLTRGTKILAMVPNPVAYEEYCFTNSDVYVVRNTDYCGLKAEIKKLYDDWINELLQTPEDLPDSGESEEVYVVAETENRADEVAL